MERHAVAKAITDRVQAEEQKKRKRRVYTSETAKEVCDYGRYHGSGAAAVKYKVCERSARKWVSEFRNSQWSDYPKVQERGRPSVFTEDMTKEMRNAIELTL
eukprot:TRINITY_DN5245_c0_g3_i1.p1 TRINITY_DN5245_c0_g3~~TRINITY_DN5245_c0_g3_i1.p1  ORF type:complete len:102 (-),score=27.00 TRINITY_DN5245_c0_g3_i1:146-451(-)